MPAAAPAEASVSLPQVTPEAQALSAEMRPAPSGHQPVFTPAPAASPAMAQQVAAQIAEISRPLPDGPLELSLQPEELGRLKLSFSGTEAGLLITVTAERPETLELMRRHIEILSQEMRRLGHEGTQFSFGGEEGAPGGQSGGGNGPPAQTLVDEAERVTRPASPVVGETPMALQAGLDLRL